MNPKIKLELPPRLLQKIQRLVDDGWFKSADDFIETVALATVTMTGTFFELLQSALRMGIREKLSGQE